MAETITNITHSWRADFPIFETEMNGKPLVYLDSAASAQKPRAVIERINHLMNCNYSNVHRGLYKISQSLTEGFECARSKIHHFANISDDYDVIFTRNATEAINLVAHSWGRTSLLEGDEIILSEVEHHANIVPWQLINKNNKFSVKFIPMHEDKKLDLDAYASLLNERTRLIAVNHVSNALGIKNNIKKIISLARHFNPGIKILIDASQSIVHDQVDFSEIGADFYVFTGHKLYGPTGVGVLIGQHHLMNDMLPYQGGGDMIEHVTTSGSTYKPSPHRFEAGTPAIMEVIGLGTAIDYLVDIGMARVAKHENDLLKTATNAIKDIDGLRIYADVPDKAPIISFTADWGHISDIAMILDQCGVAVRTGHHCCMPLMQKLGIEGTIRASFGLYNTENDIDRFIGALKKARTLLT